jgi:hypothetical protein
LGHSVLFSIFFYHSPKCTASPYSAASVIPNILVCINMQKNSQKEAFLDKVMRTKKMQGRISFIFYMKTFLRDSRGLSNLP